MTSSEKKCFLKCHIVFAVLPIGKSFTGQEAAQHLNQIIICSLTSTSKFCCRWTQAHRDRWKLYKERSSVMNNEYGGVKVSVLRSKPYSVLN